ncbi:hypothetical protein PG22506_1223 [Bifidobacterium pseudolongum subsp. globosum]|nr:hypothetical protein PG22506_1223 [Bifidobacterium pseudolongum subsp. globosum]
MRGKRARYSGRSPSRRIIPAHAGQTHYAQCGQYGETGSSPRMRGKHDRPHPNPARQRIIPAHAGQTCTRANHAGANSDHPRACGANPNAPANTGRPGGSSPRMRGKRRADCGAAAPLRIIPAHAGQTHMRSRLVTCWPDHPRACGANQMGTHSLLLSCGSSPRMRGKHTSTREDAIGMRIIPAHAGQTHGRA